jgi:hypothetical protein
VLPSFPAAFRPPAFASWASFPARGSSPPYGRPAAPPPAARTRTGFPCSARVRPGWLRVPSLPRGRRCPRRPVNLPGARLPLSSGQSLFIPDYDPPREVIVTRHQQGFTVVHPTPAFPSPVTPDGTRSSGFSLSFAPRRTGPSGARQGGDRPGHCLDYVPGISQPPSTYSLTTCDLASHNRPVLRAIGSEADGGHRRPRRCVDDCTVRVPRPCHVIIADCHVVDGHPS